MKKPWIYKRKNIKGWWVGWYEGRKRRSKALPSKKLAEHFCHIKYAQLNSDVFTGIVDIDWRQMVDQNHHAKQVEGLEIPSIYEALLTLRHYERLAGPSTSRYVTQQSVDEFILERGKEVAKNTLNSQITSFHCDNRQMFCEGSQFCLASVGDFGAEFLLIGRRQ